MLKRLLYFRGMSTFFSQNIYDVTPKEGIDKFRIKGFPVELIMKKLPNPFTSCGPLWVRNAPKPSPGVPKEMSQHFLVVVQVEHGDQEALDDLPGLLTVVRLGGRGLERVERRLHGTLHG